MTVADLIAVLQQHDPHATVVLWDHEERPGPLVSRLKPSGVQPLQLTSWESHGVLVLEVRPIPGVVLGSM